MNESNGNEPRPAPAERQTKRHPLTEAERNHIAEVRMQMAETEGEILKLKGAIWDKQHEMDLMRRHLALYVGTIATTARLPMGSMLSPDGTALIERGA